MKLPAHIACALTHNEHRLHYQTVQGAIDDHLYEEEDWVSAEQRAKAIATNDCWTLHWYPDTPVGFCESIAADLDVLLEYVCRGTQP